MSIVNLNITFVKKQKQTRPTQGRGETEMVVFTLKTDYSCETGYPFDNSPQIFVNGIVLILNEQSAWLYPSILTHSLKMDYPFHWEPLYSRPLPSQEIGEGMSVGEGETG